MQGRSGGRAEKPLYLLPHELQDWYDDYMECRSGAKQRLRIRAMYKKRHIDNHLEYLQVDMEIT